MPFRTYEAALKYAEAKMARSRRPLKTPYIMTRRGEYTVAWGLEDREYAEAFGWVLAAE